MIIDSQVHIWEPDRPGRRWPAWGLNVDHGKGPALRAEDVLSQLPAAGVDRVVLVPPSFEGDRNDVVIAAAARFPDRFGVMGRLALDDGDAPAQLRAWRDQPGMLGVRLVFVHGPSASWLHDGTADWIWPAAESAGIPVAVLAPGKTAAIGAVAEAHPGLKLIVDHLNIPTDHPKEQPLGKVVGEVLELASLPNVAVKASALPFFTLSTYPFPDLQKVVYSAVEAFGAHRVFWGSDLSRLPCGYGELVRFFSNLDLISEAERRLLLGEGLRQWLAWET